MEEITKTFEVHEERDLVRVSKAMSYALRHGGDKIGIPMKSDGFVKVAELLMWKRLQKEGVDEHLVQEVVRRNDKKRYILEMRDDGLYIAAAQGHSIKRIRQPHLKKIEDPAIYPIVVHGTTHDKWPSIQEKGLLKMDRLHIHFAKGLPGEDGVVSGMRKSCNIFIYVDLDRAMHDGIEFYESANGVLLSEGVDGCIPMLYFKRVDLKEKGNIRTIYSNTEK